MAHDIFNLDDGIVDQDTNTEGDRQQTHDVERKTKEVHHPEGWKNRQRESDRRDRRCAPVAKKEQYHDDGEYGALVKRMHGRFVISQRVTYGRIDQPKFDVGMRLVDFRDARADGFLDRYVAGSFGAENTDSHDRGAVETRKSARLGDRVG